MKTGIMLHNLSQLSIPFIVTVIALTKFPGVSVGILFFVAMIGAYVPDIDHLNMYGKISNKGFFDFIKIVMRAERYRRAFLAFHNHLTMLIVAVSIPVAIVWNFFAGIFFLSFPLHLVLDYLADVLLIKTHSHWKFRNWL